MIHLVSISLLSSLRSHPVSRSRNPSHNLITILTYAYATNFSFQDAVVAKEIDSKTDLIQEESIPSEHRSYMPASNSVSNAIAPPDGQDLWPQGRSDMPQIKNLNVKCEKNHMKVNIEFDRPFYGMVFSKGHYNDAKCVHLAAGAGLVSSNFDIFLGACGMTSSESGLSPTGTPGSGLFIENTIIIQYDAQVQEIWDQARRLRCTWYDYYEKAVTFKSFSVEMQDAVTANFLGDNIQCWMQIQAGKGPWASEVAGIVKIGQTMTMVLAIKDDESKFDMLVRNCIAHDGKHQPIQLVDDQGCVIRPKIMSKFHKVKNFGQSATVVSYAYFQAFKFPDSMNVHFQCVIQVCRHECPDPACEGSREGDGYVPPARDSDSRLVAVGNRMTAQSSRVPVYRPAAASHTSSAFPPVTQFMHRTGDVPPASASLSTASRSPDEDVRNAGYKISRTGGMPRSLPLRRRRRDQVDSESTEIKTHVKIIQVVAPGDMAFSLSTIEAEEVPSVNQTSVMMEEFELEKAVCISTTSAVAGVVLMLLLLSISCLVSGFLYIKMRQMTKVSYTYGENAVTYDNPVLMNSLSYSGLAAVIAK